MPTINWLIVHLNKMAAARINEIDMNHDFVSGIACRYDVTSVKDFDIRRPKKNYNN